MAEKLTVLLTGATGSAGSGVLKACLEHPEVNKVSLLVRRSTGRVHKKINEIIHGDFLDYSLVEDKLAGYNACFWCLGTSSMKVPKDEYYRITYEFTMEAARILEKLNPGMVFCFLSGAGTDATQKSRMRWARVKGKAETELGKYNFRLFNFRPGFIHPVKGEKTGSLAGSLLYPFIKNSRTMCVEADEFGRAMINASLHGFGKQTLENRDIRELASLH
jgi:uncharacterized protein YbjT (DUF2867 family)